jgi:hypothetical protein
VEAAFIEGRSKEVVGIVEAKAWKKVRRYLTSIDHRMASESA